MSLPYGFERGLFFTYPRLLFVTTINSKTLPNGNPIGKSGHVNFRDAYTIF